LTPRVIGMRQEGAPKEGGYTDVMEGTAYVVEEPVWESCLLEDLEDPGMVDRVEGLGSVKEEDKLLVVVGNSLVEIGIEVFGEGVATGAREEALLSWVKEGDNSRHDGPGDGAGQETVVGVGDTDRASVTYKASFFLGDQEKKTVVEASRGGKA
jgi:hypothetical protein